MRNPTAIATHGTGKSRSKPLHKMHHQGTQPSKKILAQQRGYLKLMNLYAAVIKKTAKPVEVRMNKTRFAVKQGIAAMKSGFKLNINKS
ncbi:MAG TPA: hypothetical protein ENJ28_05065 [Gammaproteobacteria bacterium]|nr:hypothetical protein [Gammaproteobacteria bacterium]